MANPAPPAWGAPPGAPKPEPLAKIMGDQLEETRFAEMVDNLGKAAAAEAAAEIGRFVANAAACRASFIEKGVPFCETFVTVYGCLAQMPVAVIPVEKAPAGKDEAPDAEQQAVAAGAAALGVVARAAAPTTISGDFLGRLSELPQSAQAVWTDPVTFKQLCEPCMRGDNVRRIARNVVVGCFCETCVRRLALTEKYICQCGKPRFFDFNMHAKGKVCKPCHQSGTRRKRRGKKN